MGVEYEVVIKYPSGEVQLASRTIPVGAGTGP